MQPLSAEELLLQREKVRIYALARELNMESKDLLDLCRQAGLDVKNQLSSLDPEQRDAIELMVKKGGRAGVALAAAPPAASVVAPRSLSTAVPTLPSARPARREQLPTEPPKATPVPPPGPARVSEPAAEAPTRPAEPAA